MSLIIIGRSASGEQGLQTQVAHRSPPPRQNGLLEPFCTLCILAAQRTKAAAHLKVIFHEAYMEGAERDTSLTKPMRCSRWRLWKTFRARPAATPTRLARHPYLRSHRRRQGSLSCPPREAGDALKDYETAS